MLLLMFSICGCRDNVKKIDYSDKYVFGQDSQENCIALQGCAVIAESSKSYYYLCEDNKFLYVVDKTSKKCMPLCNKTNCLHDKEATPENCNAFLGVTADSIIFYNDYLYYSSSKEYTDKDGVQNAMVVPRRAIAVVVRNGCILAGLAGQEMKQKTLKNALKYG